MDERQNVATEALKTGRENKNRERISRNWSSSTSLSLSLSLSFFFFHSTSLKGNFNTFGRFFELGGGEIVEDFHQRSRVIPWISNIFDFARHLHLRVLPRFFFLSSSVRRVASYVVSFVLNGGSNAVCKCAVSGDEKRDQRWLNNGNVFTRRMREFQPLNRFS